MRGRDAVLPAFAVEELRPRHLLLLDEPFSNLDASLRVSVRSEVRKILKHTGTSAIFVTHDQEEAFTISDQIAVQFHGHIEQVGSPSEIYNQPKTRQIATLVGKANFLPGNITKITRFIL